MPITATICEKASFNAAAEKTINRALEICNQRGNEYQDSWALENLKTPFLDNILRALNMSLTPEEKRLVVISGLCDVKISRLTGAWKSDTTLDMVNYIGSLTTWREEYEKKKVPGVRSVDLT